MRVKKKEKKRLIETKKYGCPFTLKGIKLLTNDDQILVVKCGRHNYAKAQYLKGYSCANHLN